MNTVKADMRTAQSWGKPRCVLIKKGALVWVNTCPSFLFSSVEFPSKGEKRKFLKWARSEGAKISASPWLKRRI